MTYLRFHFDPSTAGSAARSSSLSIQGDCRRSVGHSREMILEASSLVGSLHTRRPRHVFPAAGVGRVAQFGRASALHAEGRGFDACRVHFVPLAQRGRASDSKSEGRGFNSPTARISWCKPAVENVEATKNAGSIGRNRRDTSERRGFAWVAQSGRAPQKGSRERGRVDVEVGGSNPSPSFFAGPQGASTPQPQEVSHVTPTGHTQNQLGYSCGDQYGPNMPRSAPVDAGLRGAFSHHDGAAPVRRAVYSHVYARYRARRSTGQIVGPSSRRVRVRIPSSALVPFKGCPRNGPYTGPGRPPGACIRVYGLPANVTVWWPVAVPVPAGGL